MNFADAKSKTQVAVFRLYELHAARWRNSQNLARWNDACRARWELAQLSAPRLVSKP